MQLLAGNEDDLDFVRGGNRTVPSDFYRVVDVATFKKQRPRQKIALH